MTPNMILGIEKWQRINKCTFFSSQLTFNYFFFCTKFSIIIVTIINKKYHQTDSYSIMFICSICEVQLQPPNGDTIKRQ